MCWIRSVSDAGDAFQRPQVEQGQLYTTKCDEFSIEMCRSFDRNDDECSYMYEDSKWRFKYDEYYITSGEMCIKNDDICINNDGTCIKNDEICIKNDELCIKIDEF